MSIPILRNPTGQALLAGSLSGVLTFLSFPPADLGPLAFVALIPLAWFFRKADGGRQAVASAAFSIAFFGPLIWWMRLLAEIAFVGLMLAQSLWMVAALQAGQFIKRPLGRLRGKFWQVAAFPLAFLAGEYLRSHLPLGGFGWGGLGYTQHDNPLALKLAAYTGVWGLSLMVLATNTALAEVFAEGRIRRPRTGRLVAVALAFALVPGLLPSDAPDGKQVRIAMVQADVPENTDDPRSDDLVVLNNNLRLTKAARSRHPSLVVWPEGSFDRDPSRDDRLGKPLVRIVRETKTPFLVGAVLFTNRGERRVQNSSLFMRPDGSVSGVYSKQHPVPFGEWVPFRKVLSPWVKELERVPYDLAPGEESTVFTLPQGRFASVICYESTYPGLVRSFVENGARLLVVSTNDSSFGRTPASAQHVAFSQLRAAEHRMWVAHTALSGISAVVAPTGKILAESRLFEPELFVPRMRFATRTTVYAKTGDWLPALVLTSVAACMAWEVARGLRQRKPDPTSPSLPNVSPPEVEGQPDPVGGELGEPDKETVKALE